MRVCAEGGCGLLVAAGVRDARCDEHRRARDKARGSRAERGYGAAHQATRAELLPLAYGTRCPHCDEFMFPHHDLHLDHTEDRTGYVGIVHAYCNTSDAARRGNTLRISLGDIPPGGGPNIRSN